jgi:hypothetical protein
VLSRITSSEFKNFSKQVENSKVLVVTRSQSRKVQEILKDNKESPQGFEPDQLGLPTVKGAIKNWD